MNGKFEEIDSKIISALQADPLAKWSLVADVVGADAVTLARRWERLRADGRCWSTVYPGDGLMAMVEIDTVPSMMEDVARGLAKEPQFVTIERMAGDRDLLCTVMTRSVHELSNVLRTALSMRPGVRSSRAQVVTRLFHEGSRWSLRALDHGQVQRIREEAPLPLPSREDAPREWKSMDRKILAELSDDVRIPGTTLAHRLGVAPTTVRNRLRYLRQTGMLIARTEVARTLTEWPLSATFWGSVAPNHLQRAALTIRSIAQMRMCAAVTGQYNLMFQMWLASPLDVLLVESQISEKFPELRLVDSGIALEQYKLMGRELDVTGRSVGPAIPIDPWAESQTPTAV